ncbi:MULTISPECIES: YaiO family outer membrane beta-barrel protein [unclassified Brevundimonas]|uniref:YaiO family outer membrane beta-barrel protein n=1 Tax=unclassified Brevundimonas TaxID=2622653 RepID=UPI00142F69E4|nr:MULTISPECIES: YaiO family outer membrane beta-barrel protein [unclassified Brevundimonas]
MIVLEPAAVVQPDLQTLYASAVADRLAGRAAAAVPKLQHVLASRPDDVDARLNLGLALLAMGVSEDAGTAFKDVIARAPDYVDAHIGLARARRHQGDLEAARRSVDHALSLAPGHPDALALADALKAGPMWRIDLSAARSRLTGGLPDWTEARLSASRAIGASWTAGGGLEITRRFKDTDAYLEARADRRLTGGSAWVSIGGAPSADYRAEIAVAGGGRVTVASGLAVTLEASASRYGSGVVTGIHPGFAADLAGDRLQVWARWINVRDEAGEPRQGYSVQARWQATGRLALRTGLSDAPETSEGVTADVTSWSAGFDLSLSDRLMLRVGHLSEDRGAYARREMAVGLGWRF